MAEASEDQRLIGDAARGLLREAGGVARARRRRDPAAGLDREVWARMAENGWQGMLLPEARGGAGFAPLDIVELLEALGEELAPEPVAATLAAVAALAELPGAAAGTLLEQALAGAQAVCLVDARAGAVLPADAPPDGACSRWRTDLHLADTLLVVAERDGEALLVAVPKTHDGVDLRLAATVDGGTSGYLVLAAGLPGSLAPLATGAAAASAAARGRDLERLANAAVLTGLAGRALDIAAQYLRDRTQFGVPIGSFQALQHRAATLHVETAAARALVRESLRAFAGPRAGAVAAAAKHYAGETALHVTREAIQLHGAIGFTDEHDIGLYLRRALALVAADGGSAAALRRWMAERSNIASLAPA